MKVKKKAYSSRSLGSADRSSLLSALGVRGGGTLGADVAKHEIVVCLRYGDGTFERPWKFGNDRAGIESFVGFHRELSLSLSLPVGLESTGTYGDVFRHQLTAAGCEVRRVGNTSVSDYAEIFDGVPSQHDGKDAAIIAELVALGKSQLWPWESGSSMDHELERWVDWLDIHQCQEQEWQGRLESALQRYWPELPRLLSFRSSSLLWLLEKYGDPRAMAADATAAAELRKFAGPLLSEEKLQAVLESGRETAGIPMCPSERAMLQSRAQEIRRCRDERHRAEKELKRLTADHAQIQAFAEVVGLVTACVLWVDVGDVRQYTSGAAYRKAMGLNLKVQSSGQYEGHLKLTKRGSSRVRRWLYFAALRLCQTGSVKTWYEAKKAKDGLGGKAMIAIMRKLVLALYRVGTEGVAFDAERLFPGRPLPPLTSPAASPSATGTESSPASKGPSAAEPAAVVASSPTAAVVEPSGARRRGSQAGSASNVPSSPLRNVASPSEEAGRKSPHPKPSQHPPRGGGGRSAASSGRRGRP